MKIEKTNLKKYNYKDIYLVLTLISVVLVIISLMISDGNRWSTIFFSDTMDTGMDFFNSIQYVVGGAPYRLFNVIYPPLANLFFYVLLLFIPASQQTTWATSFEEILHARGTGIDLRVCQSTMMLFLIFVVSCALIVVFLCTKVLGEKDGFILGVCALSSYGVLYCFERGNILILSVICVFFFFQYKDSENNVLSELALIALAVAAGLKIYPAFFGVFLVYEKQLKKAIRTVFYGIIAFFAPFFVFQEKLGGFELLLNNISDFYKDDTFSTQGFSFDKIFNTCQAMAQNLLGNLLKQEDLVRITWINIFMGGLLLAMAIVLKKKWEQIAAGSLAVLLFQNQPIYYLAFMTVAMIFFLKEESTIDRNNLAPFIGLAGMTILLPLTTEVKDVFSAQYLRIQFFELVLVGYLIFICMSRINEDVREYIKKVSKNNMCAKQKEYLDKCMCGSKNMFSSNVKNKKTVFYFLMWIAISTFMISGLFTHGDTIVRYLHNFPDDTFMDFFNSMQYERQPYERGVIYPPLANLIYYFLHFFIPRDIFCQGPVVIRTSQMGRLVLAGYIMVSTLFFTYLVLKLYNGILEDKIMLCLTLILSGPFIYQLERANLILISCCCVIIFVYGYRSDKKLIRHIAFIALAVATSLKIYPAVFGLLLIRERRWKDSMICIGYGITIFVSPMIFFGGLKNFPVFIENIVSTSKKMIHSGYGWKVDITNTFGWFGVMTGYVEQFVVAGKVCLLFCLLLGIAIIIFANFEHKWKIVAIPSIMMILIPSFSFVYSLIFMTIPLILFLNEESKSKLDYVYLFLFMIILIPIINPNLECLGIFAGDNYILTLSTIIESVATFIFMFLLYCEGIRSILNRTIFKCKFSGLK